MPCKAVDNLAAAPWMQELPNNTRLPIWAREPDALAARLRRRCFILLGDSTMAETAHDLALLSGADFTTWLQRATRMHVDESKLSSNGVSGAFYPDHRNFTLSLPGGGRVYERFIGAVKLADNGEGVRVLQNPALRATIERSISATCGELPRELWLQTGYHDPEGHLLRGHSRPITEAYDEAVNASLPWLEALAPKRSFLSRHSVGMYRLEKLNHYWRARLSSRVRCTCTCTCMYMYVCTYRMYVCDLLACL